MLDILVLRLCIKTRAVLGGKVAMSSDDGLGEDVAKGSEKLTEGCFLCWGAGILGVVVVVG